MTPGYVSSRWGVGVICLLAGCSHEHGDVQAQLKTHSELIARCFTRLDANGSELREEIRRTNTNVQALDTNLKRLAGSSLNRVEEVSLRWSWSNVRGSVFDDRLAAYASVASDQLEPGLVLCLRLSSKGVQKQMQRAAGILQRLRSKRVPEDRICVVVDPLRSGLEENEFELALINTITSTSSLGL